MIYTTLNRIREHSPCSKGWKKLLGHLGKTHADDEPVALLTVLDSNGLDDALWCLHAEPQHANIWRMYAVRCARSVQHLMTDPRSIAALDVAERHAQGQASDSELDAASAAARDAAGDAAWDAAWDAMATDFKALLAAHESAPGESCALVCWFAAAEAA